MVRRSVRLLIGADSILLKMVDRSCNVFVWACSQFLHSLSLCFAGNVAAPFIDATTAGHSDRIANEGHRVVVRKASDAKPGRELANPVAADTVSV